MDEKKSFVLYYDDWNIISKLTKEQQCVLLQAIFATGGVCEMPVFEDVATDIVFTKMNADIKRNRDKWESVRKKRSEAGRKGGKATQAKSSDDKQDEAMLSNAKQDEANQAVNVNDNVNGNVNVNANVNVNNKTYCASDDAPCAKNEKKTEPSKTDIDNHYNALWDRYPKKKGKSAVSATRRRKLMKVSLDEMERAVERYRNDCENESFPRELMDGSTWFNGRYEDYLDATYETNRTTSTDYLDYLIRKDLEHKDDDDDEGWSYGSI